ncbi:hypothetical protein ACFLST_00320 [Chloroflexota bacterium]
MKLWTWVVSILGFVGIGSFAMGIVMSTEEVTIDVLPDTYTPTFWLVIAAVLILAAIASGIIGMLQEK